ncbi:MAG: Holliday junction branch migration protein RuvA [Oscillospiraceae bacterium]|nr:Holliday junction branch migration protein RuvA [Oscillospiraceae bacterium]
MIYSLTGRLTKKTESFVVIDCSGVGYKCSATLSTISKLGELNKDVTLYTYLSVKEDAFDLYGFLDEIELECFKLLLSVSGVGAKFALSILSALSPDDVIRNIQISNSEIFTTASGVGTKLSQRITLELKSKAQKWHFADGVATLPANNSNILEALNALEALGYSRTHAADSLKDCDSNWKVEEIIRQGLKNLSPAR